MKQKKGSTALKLISLYFIIHGALYIAGYFIATRFFIWESQYNWLFGNPSLFSLNLFIPFALGAVYIIVAYGLLKGNHYGQIGLLLLCAQAILLEMPIGIIIGFAIIAYSFSPRFLKLFKKKTRTNPYHLAGLFFMAVGVAGFLTISGFVSTTMSITTHQIYGFDTLSAQALTPPQKIINIQQQVGPIDVLVELTETDFNYFADQQAEVILNLSTYINNVIQQFEVVNSISMNVNAEDILTIAENENIYRISEIVPVAGIFPVTLNAETTSTTASILNQLAVTGLKDAGLSGQGVIVAVIDTGIKHDLFPGSIIGSYSVSGEQYVDSHGSMVCSCVLAIAPNAKILDVNVFRDEGMGVSASRSDIFAGYDYIIDYQKTSTEPIIISCSWGVSPLSWMDANSIAIASSNIVARYDMPLIAACGNEGTSASIPFQIMSPSGGINIFAVGSVTDTNQLSSFSSKGPFFNGLNKPDCVAPGTDVPVIDINTGTYSTTASGTSFSCPYVSGIAALLLENMNDMQPENLYYSLQQGATDLGATGYDHSYGYGLVNAEESLSLSQSTLSEFDTTVLMITTVFVGALILLFPTLNRRLRAL